ncbi:hypothetical protein Gotur_011359 [Gossypium turneri]
MPRLINKEDAAPSDDYGWRWEESVEDYGDSGDDDDDELTIARRESMRSQVEWEEKQRRRARTSQDSVFEIGARLANMDTVLETSKSLKQSKLSLSFLKNAKAKLGKATSKLILHMKLYLQES